MYPQKVPGEAIRKLCHYKGFKQSYASKKIGISQQAYSKLEKSENVNALKLHQAIKAFEYTSEDFEKLNGYPPPTESI